MTKHKTKAELLKDIQIQRRQLQKNLDVLKETEMITPRAVGNWSFKDLLAHLLAWEKLFLSWYETGLQNRTPEIAPVGLSKKAIDELNERIFVQNQARSLEEIRAEFQASYQRLWTILQTIPEEDMFAKGRYPWTGALTLADYIAGNTCNHYRWAKTQIRRWFKNQVQEQSCEEDSTGLEK